MWLALMLSFADIFAFVIAPAINAVVVVDGDNVSVDAVASVIASVANVVVATAAAGSVS
jgi:hypothetical protein